MELQKYQSNKAVRFRALFVLLSDTISLLFIWFNQQIQMAHLLQKYSNLREKYYNDSK